MTDVEAYESGYEPEEREMEASQTQAPDYQPISDEEISALQSALREIKHLVNNASKAFLRSDSCIVNRSEIDTQVRALEASIPAAVRSADHVLANQNEVLQTAREHADEVILKADQKARDTVNAARKEEAEILGRIEEAKKHLQDIQAQGDQLRQQLEQQARQAAQAIEEQAKQRGRQMLAEAERQAQALCEEEAVLQRAKQQADELTRKTEEAMGQLQQQTFAFLNDAMKRTEQYVGSLGQDIRRQREELKSIQ